MKLGKPILLRCFRKECIKIFSKFWSLFASFLWPRANYSSQSRAICYHSPAKIFWTSYHCNPKWAMNLTRLSFVLGTLSFGNNSLLSFSRTILCAFFWRLSPFAKSAIKLFQLSLALCAVLVAGCNVMLNLSYIQITLVYAIPQDLIGIYSG